MKLPLGIQDFRVIREEGYVYVDKTRELYGIIQQRSYYFLSRPRRFGKSLLLSTLNELYTGQRDLFRGLWIEDKWDWTITRPVIWLKFSSMAYESKGLERAIYDELITISDSFGLDLRSQPEVKDVFRTLLQTLYDQKGPVAILVDEYDKPIINYIDDAEKMDANRAILKAFYSILKDAGKQIDLLFITGVSAFSQVSIFSDLNITNLTLHPKAVKVVGITQEELEHTFKEQMVGIDRRKLRSMYGGYSWDGITKLYNPCSLLRYFDTHLFQSHWFQTGTPTFLVKMLQRKNRLGIKNKTGLSSDLLTDGMDNGNILPVLFQTGYLTLVDQDEYGVCELDYPNIEVKRSLRLFLPDEFTEASLP